MKKKARPWNVTGCTHQIVFCYALLDRVENSDISEIVSLNLCLISQIMGSEACDRVDEEKVYHVISDKKVQRFDLKCTPLKDNNSSTKPSLFGRPNLLSMLNLPDKIKRSQEKKIP